jgi:hypothetical protein
LTIWIIDYRTALVRKNIISYFKQRFDTF